MKIFVVLLLATFSSLADARDKYTKKLQSSGQLGIEFRQCKEIESKLGQLLYVNVDGYGNNPNKNAIDPAYIKMVSDLQIGGVLPHPGTREIGKLQKDYKSLREATTQPLMVGIDYHDVDSTYFGLGYGFGFLGDNGRLSGKCFKMKSYLDAFLHKAVGLNHALGPTIETNDNNDFLKRGGAVVSDQAGRLVDGFDSLGVATTMKHYPYTPMDYNLHDKSEDTKIPEARVNEMLEVYRAMNNRTDFAMSTHLYNSNIDPDDMATFSKKWVGILRDRLGFDGVLMTDALFMFSQYDATMKQMSSRWPQDQVKIDDQYTIFAARAILSGHDMAFLEGTSADTYRIFNNLLKIACQDKPISREFRARVNESYSRIIEYKQKHKTSLMQDVSVPSSLISKASDLYNNNLCSKEAEFDAFKKEVEALGIFHIDHGQSTGPEGKSQRVVQ